MNEEQRRVVEAPHDRHVLCEAGPGAGKTRTMVWRLEALLERGLDPEGMVVLTFSRSACEEIRERLKGVDGVMIATFHSLALALLQEAHTGQPTAGFSILSEADQGLLIDVLLKVRRLPTSYRTARVAEYFERGSGKDPVLDLLKKDYDAWLVKLNAYDFHGLLQAATALVPHSKPRLHHIILDEFQDSVRLDYDLLRALLAANPHCRCTVVFDTEQAIYGFRTLRSEEGPIDRIRRDFDPLCFSLLSNYRSTAPIVDAGRRFLLSRGIERATQCIRGPGGAVTFHPCIDLDSQRQTAARLAAEAARGGGTVAVLARRNKDLEEIHSLAESADQEPCGYTRKDVETAVLWLRALFVSDPPALLRLWLDAVGGRMSIAQARIWAGQGRKGALKQLMGSPCKRAKAMGARIQAIKEELAARPPTERVLIALERVGINPAIIDHLTAAVPEEDAPCTPNRLIQSLALGSAKPGTPLGGITVQSMHASKGLEYDTVILLGMDAGVIPLGGERCDDTQGEARLFYVGISRARTHLRILFTEGGASPFLESVR